MKIGVLSDIHGNSSALVEVLSSAKMENIDKLLILGDIVGYYYHPDKVLDMLAGWECIRIRGNHEKIMEQILLGNMNELALRRKYGSGHRFAREKLSAEQLNQLINDPDQKMVLFDNVRILMCHGSPWDPDYYLYPDTDKQILDRCNETDMDFVLAGHSHYSFSYKNINSTLLNPGSVGQSRRAGGVANWAVIDTVTNGFELKSTPYDVRPLLMEIDQIDPDIKYLKDVLIRNKN